MFWAKSICVTVLLCLVVFTGGRALLQSASKANSNIGNPDASPIVLLIFDEFPEAILLNKKTGRIDSKRFPNISALSEQGVWYKNHTTSADLTVQAVPSILTGTRPGLDTFPTEDQQPNNIFNLAHTNGYNIKAQEAVTQLCSSDLCPPEKGNAHIEASTASSPFNFLTAKIGPISPTLGTRYKPFVDSLTPQKNQLVAIHSIIPHEPYQYLPSGKKYPDNNIPSIREPDQKGNVKYNQQYIDMTYQRLIYQTAYVDTIIGEIIDKYKKAGIWDETMFVVTGDHGVSLQPNTSRRIVDKNNLSSIAFTPLIIKYPGQEKGRISSRNTQSVDILPTISKEANWRNVFETTGKSIDKIRSRKTNIQTHKGTIYTKSISSLKDRREETVDSIYKAVGGKGLEALGPRPDLIGTKIKSSIKFKKAAFLYNPSQYTNVDLDLRKVPAFVTGETDIKSGVVAMAVNGKIRATTRIFDHKGKNLFAALIPDELLRENNSIKVYYAGKRLIRVY